VLAMMTQPMQTYAQTMQTDTHIMQTYAQPMQTHVLQSSKVAMLFGA